MEGTHPRLWFDAEKAEQVKAHLNSPKFKSTADAIRSNALDIRTQNPVDGFVYDIDQFPEEDWLASLDGWFDRVRVWRHGVYYNTLAYTFFDDREAGEYARDLLVTISKFPYLVHPWFNKRGRFIYYPLGEAGTEFALGYDCLLCQALAKLHRHSQPLFRIQIIFIFSKKHIALLFKVIHKYP